MQKHFKRPYLDSSVYIAAINSETTRVRTVKAILEAADRSEIQIVASTFVAAEVIKRRGEEQYLSADHETEIDAILRSDRILWVELDFSLAIQARKLARAHNLKPGDAIHLASAIRGKADILLRYDSGFQTNSALDGIEICDPYWYGPATLFDDANG